MNVLYIMRSSAHATYHESVIRHLCRNGHAVQVLWDRQPTEACGDLDDHVIPEGVPCDRLIRRADHWRKLVFTSRELLSYASYLNRPEQSAYYLKRWESYQPYAIRQLVRFSGGRTLLASSGAQSALRVVERLAPPDHAITEWLRETRPDVVVASPLNMRFSEEVEYVKAAKALGIPTVVPVLSWDNLTTKGVFHVIPDLTLAWNDRQREEAIRIHRVPQDRVVVTGAPLFDKWFETNQVGQEREAFYRKIGLEPGASFVAYLGSSAHIALDETWLVRDVIRALRDHPSPAVRALAVVVRPHPANAKIYESLREPQVTVWPRGGALPDSEESIQDFHQTLRYCVATVGINTTGMIDSVIADKPCVAILTERYQATQSQAVHFQYLLDAGVLELATSAEECARMIEQLWRGLDSRRETRQQFVREFVRPRGIHRPAGQVAAHAIELAAVRKEAAQIDAAIASIELEPEACHR
jgi:hypothetical protein